MIARLRLQLRRDFYHWTFVLFLLLYLGFFAKSWFSVSGNIYDGDDCSYAGFVMSLANDFDVDLSNQDLFVKISPNPVTGKAQIGHPIGTSILLLPFYLAAKPVVLLVSLLRGMPFNEKDPLFFVVLCSAIIFYFYLGGFFLRRALRYFVNGLAADLAVIVSMWGTILPIYVFRRLIFSHVPEFFLLSLLVYVLTWYYRCPRVGINMSVVLGVLMGGNLVIRYGNFYLILFTMLSIFYLVRLKTLFRGSRLRNVIFYEFVLFFF